MEKAKIATETVEESAARKRMVPEAPVIVMQLVEYNVEMTLSPLETTIS